MTQMYYYDEDQSIDYEDLYGDDIEQEYLYDDESEQARADFVRYSQPYDEDCEW